MNNLSYRLWWISYTVVSFIEVLLALPRSLISHIWGPAIFTIPVDWVLVSALNITSDSGFEVRILVMHELIIRLSLIRGIFRVKSSITINKTTLTLNVLITGICISLSFERSFLNISKLFTWDISVFTITSEGNIEVNSLVKVLFVSWWVEFDTDIVDVMILSELDTVVTSPAVIEG